MSDAFRQVYPGDPLQLSATTFNELLTAAKSSKFGGAAGGVPVEVFGSSSVVVRVQNYSGSDVPVRSVLWLTDVITDLVDTSLELARRPLFKGEKPLNTGYPFAVTLEPIKGLGNNPANGIGLAVISGVAVVDVYVNNTSDSFAEPTPLITSYLTSTRAGNNRILVRESGTGLKRAIVLINSAESRVKVRGKLDGVLNQGGSATLSVWMRSGASEIDSGENITVYDWLLSTGQSIASGKKVTAFWDKYSLLWYVDGAECS